MCGKGGVAGNFLAARSLEEFVGFEVQLTGVVRRLLQWLVFVSAPVVEQVLEAQEHCPYEHHCACCFKWDHRVGMIHSIARRRSPKDYGAMVTVALRARM
jgi:hypothetical protein